METIISHGLCSHISDPDSLEDSPKNMVLFVGLLNAFILNSFVIDERLVIVEIYVYRIISVIDMEI